MSDIFETEKKLNAVSSSFCLAKWTDVTIHLESGTTHSCHHPPAHKIPLEELEKNPAALHNSQFKIDQRKKMLAGERPAECEYCWKIEDLKTNEVSDRILKSSLDWSSPSYDEIINDPLSTKFKPKYVEVSFSHACQFKCSYCSANHSTRWEKELKKFGNYATCSGIKDVTTYSETENPYIKAFWEWWPELKKDLYLFRITGGEPLLSSNTFKFLENLLDFPEPNLTVAINSNLGVPVAIIDRLQALTEKLIYTKSVKKVELYTSIDAYGPAAEYIRHGFKNDCFWKNINTLLTKIPSMQVMIMCTFNALSVTSYIDLLKKIMDINRQHRHVGRLLPLGLDIVYLRYPEYQTLQVLPNEYLIKMEEILEFIKNNQWQNTAHDQGFHELQIIQFKRVLEWMRQGISEDRKKELRKNFYLFFSEHDRRRGSDFLKAFPELNNFWLDCEKEAAERPPSLDVIVLNPSNQ